MIIGICGHKGSGKSTVSEVAINLKRGNYVRMGFSDPLYQMLIAMGIPRVIVWDKSRWNEPLDILSGKTCRFACDTLGNDWGRDTIGIDTWANIGLHKAKELEKDGQTVIIDNVRYFSEARKIIENGGKIIAFYNPVMIMQVSDMMKPSEREIPEIREKYCFHEFNNFGTELETTALRFRALLNEITLDAQLET